MSCTGNDEQAISDLIDAGLDYLIPPNRSTDYAYRMGLDCAKNGANETNCNFAIFSLHKNMKAWERGKNDVEQTI